VTTSEETYLSDHYHTVVQHLVGLIKKKKMQQKNTTFIIL